MDKVIVVGAGVAGIFAAYLLKQKGVDVTILEAANRHGGRVFTLRDFADFPIELGAETIHGKDSFLYDSTKSKKIPLVPKRKNGKEYYILADKAARVKEFKKDSDFKDYETFFDNYYKYEGESISLKQFLKNNKVPQRVWQLYEAFAAEFGTSPKRLNFKSLAQESSHWTSGEQNYRLKVSFEEVLREYIDFLGDDILLNQEVKSIDYSNNFVEIVTKDCQLYRADKVLLTVPLTMLKKKNINFLPKLPKSKRLAIKSIGMDSAGFKVILKFKERFWQKNMGELIGAKVVSEYWAIGKGKEGKNNILTAWVMGKKAEKLSLLSEKELVKVLLEELDSLFENQASALFEKHHSCDWSKVPFIEGSYSYATKDSLKHRKNLAQNIQGKVFFAGEATHFDGHAATVHGALETAQRSVKEILKGK
jgi:monoamine oxidase